MHCLLIRLLLWLVVLALPLQGSTATAMMARGGAMDNARVALATPDDGAVMSDGCHEHEDVVAIDAESEAPAQSHCKTCPICAVCSLGPVVPLAASLDVLLVKLSGAVPRSLAVSLRSFISEALQRPPSIRVWRH